MQALAFRAGDKIGEYAVLHVVGDGSTSTVYEALHGPHLRRVALRIPRWRDLTMTEDPSRPTARFRSKARLAADVRHPHIVELFEVDETEGIPFVALEFVDGEALARRLSRAGPVPSAEAAELLLPILSAVAKLHAAGWVRRDIKPSSILLARGPVQCPKLSDFGFGHSRDASAWVGPPDDHANASAYTAPELALFSPTAATERSDQYSLGAILYECTTGDRPFRGATPSERWQAASSARLEPPSSLDPSLPRAFDEIVLRAMSRDPDSRFASVTEFARALLPLAAPDVAARWRRELERDSCRPAAQAVTGSASRVSSRSSIPPRAAESRRPLSTRPSVDAGLAGTAPVSTASSTGCRICFLRPVFFVRWIEPRAADLPTVHEELEAAHHRHGGPLIYVAIVPEECTPPDDRTRAGFIARMHEVLERCETMHFVMEGQGFKNAILRASLTAVLLVRGQRAKVFVHNTLEQALTSANARASESSRFLVQTLLHQARNAGLTSTV